MKKALLTKFSAIVLIILVVLSMTACKPEEIDYLIMKTAIGNSAYYPNIGLVVDINPIDIDYDDLADSEKAVHDECFKTVRLN